jgi:beta-lactam-binding protein with PASTA domain
MITFGTIVGPSKIIVPTITGLLTPAAETALNAIALTHTSTATGNSNSGLNTQVYSQSFAAGTLLLRANAQTLTYQYYTFAFYGFFSFFGFTPYGFFGFFSFSAYAYGT